MKINKLSWYALELKTTCLIFCETNICVNVNIEFTSELYKRKKKVILLFTFL